MKTTACVLAAFLILPAFAQKHRETQTVEVVEVPVYVNAPDGAIVTGLTRDNFELLVNGKRQSIDYFDVVEYGSVAMPSTAAAPAQRDPRLRRLYMLVFDRQFSAPNSIRRAQRAAEALIGDATDADEFAIATLTYNRGLEVVVPFTRDRITLTRAVRSLRVTAMADTLRLGVTQEDVQLPPSEGWQGCPPDTVCAETMQDRYRGEVEDQVANLALLAKQLRDLEGQKHVVLLSDGFDGPSVTGVKPLNPKVDVRQQAASDIAQTKMTLAGIRRFPAYDAHTLGALENLHNEFNKAGVFLDAIDIAGLRPGATVEDNEALVMMARDTGGDVVEHRNDLHEALQVLADRQRVVYVLGFHPRNARKNNSISVRLRNVEGHPELRYRRTFSSIAEANEVGAVRLADILINDIPQTGIEVRMAASKGKLDVTVPLKTLLPQIENRGEVSAFLYVFQGTRAVATNEKRITIEPAKVTGDAINFSQTFELPPGEYVAKVVLLLNGSPSIGFARQPFTIQ